MDPVRVAIYSHDTFGLGHLTRSTRIARSVLRALGDCSVLLLTGSPLAHRARLPHGVDYVKLPSVVKRDADSYPARELRISQRRVRQMRRQILLEAVDVFRPHLFLVDNVPLGMKGELLPVLRKLVRYEPACRVWLNLRDVLDDAETIRRHWRENDVHRVLQRFYDAINVFGNQSVYDSIAAYDLPAEKTAFMGYIGPTDEEGGNAPPMPVTPPGKQSVLVTIGGGGDGCDVLHQIGLLQRQLGADSPYQFHVVLGPLMESATRGELISELDKRDGITLHDYVEGLSEWMSQCDVVLSMGGYNTLCEVMARARRSVVVPRIYPRREQEIRSLALERLGLVRVLRSRDISPATLDQSLRQVLAEDPTIESSERPALDGPERLERRLRQEFTPARRQAPEPVDPDQMTGKRGQSTPLLDESPTDSVSPASPASPDTSDRTPARDGEIPAILRRILTVLLFITGCCWPGVAQAEMELRGLEAWLGLGHDGNLLNASDAERQAFDNDSPDAYFVVTEMEDQFLRGGCQGEWGLGRWLGRKMKLRAAYERTQFLDNEIKSENRYSLELQSRLRPGTRLGLELDYRPQIYGRHRRDKDAGPGEPMFRAESHERWDLDLEWKQEIAPDLDAQVVCSATWKTYAEPFPERDQRRLGFAAGAERGLRWGSPLVVGLTGEYRHSRSRNDPHRSDDRSYREWALEPTLEVLGLPSLGELELKYARKWRRYVSDDPEDTNHYQRHDRFDILQVAVTRPLSPALALTVGYQRNRRSGELDSDLEIDFDEEGSSTDDIVIAGLTWQWRP